MLVKEKEYRLCDKCKKEIRLCRDLNALFRAERPIIKGSLIRKDLDVAVGQRFPCLEFDLCTKCADEFVDWIMGG